MEVDFLCEEAKVVIELDGPQHLQDETAWRNDRRKDRLLQIHGYLIIRSPTTDIAKELNAVLDSGLSILDHCDRNRGEDRRKQRQ
jgi:very-short-patch-repair endonuclease